MTLGLMSSIRRFALIIGASLAIPVSAHAQSSVIDDLLKSAQNAFNDLNYLRADTLARQVIGMGNLATTNQRTRALLVIAAAYYPEEKEKQRPTDAMATLRQVVRTNLDLTIPQELTWPGLDSLLGEAKRTTFGIDVSAAPEQTIIGPAKGEIKVHANRPAIFRLLIAKAGGGAAVASDSTGPSTDGTLRFAAMDGDRPLFTSGDYDVFVEAREPTSGDTVVVRHSAKVDAPALQLATAPATFDSTKLVAEHTGRYGWRGIIASAFVGGAAFAIGNALRADSVKNHVPADSKAMVAAVGFSSAILLASFLDPGRVIPANVAANRQLEANFAQSVRDAATENRQRIANYRTTITMQTGVR